MTSRRHLLGRVVRTFADQADKNLTKWGTQDFETLGLAIAEETGELAQAILKARHEGGDPDRIRQEAIDLGALCAQVAMKFYVQIRIGGAPMKKQEEPDIRRRWRFYVEDQDGDGRYVGPDGAPGDDAEWIGTDAEAERESDRRAQAWENRPGSGFAARVVSESRGIVEVNHA